MLGSAALVVLLAGCGNGGASEPLQTSVDPAATSKLQFAVGVATVPGGTNGVLGLNVVETLRQANGLSGTLYNVPMIIGPSGFDVVPPGSLTQYAGNDYGTNHITWGTLNQPHWISYVRGNGQKQATTGAFGYGLCACNSDAGPVNGTSPLYQAYELPIYSSATLPWYGGSPAFPQAGPQLVALGWYGYSLGFTTFAVQPAIGTYHLYAAVPPAFNTPANPTPSPNPNGTPTPPPGVLAAGAQLTSLNALPLFATPSFTPDHKGGGRISVTVPAGASEAMVEVFALRGGNGICAESHATDSYYTIVTHRAGAQILALADNLGPLTQSGQKTPTICHGQTYYAYAAATNYPAYESSYPQNLSQLPVIKGPNGQADVSTSASIQGTYP